MFYCCRTHNANADSFTVFNRKSVALLQEHANSRMFSCYFKFTSKKTNKLCPRFESSFVIKVNQKIKKMKEFLLVFRGDYKSMPKVGSTCIRLSISCVYIGNISYFIDLLNPTFSDKGSKPIYARSYIS